MLLISKRIGGKTWLATVALVVLLALAGCGSSSTATRTAAAGTKAAATASTAASGTPFASPATAATPRPATASPGVATPAALGTAPVTMPLFGAGTLSVPFTAAAKAFSGQNSNVTIQSQFGGSVKMVKQVTDLGQQADVVAVADYSVIPQYMLGANGQKQFASWYVGFAANAITFVYTDKSKGATEINADNWYKVLAQPGVEIGRSNPDTDPSGYQTLQMLKLAEQYYHQPGLSDAIQTNAPKTNMRDTETELLAALDAGQIDYLAIYVSDARQHHLKYLELPSDINLSDASKAAAYGKVSVTTANGDLTGKPIIYALTIPTNAQHPEWAAEFAAFVLGPDGQKIMSDNGFQVLTQPLAFNRAQLPPHIQPLTVPWPGSS